MRWDKKQLYGLSCVPVDIVNVKMNEHTVKTEKQNAKIHQIAVQDPSNKGEVTPQADDQQEPTSNVVPQEQIIESQQNLTQLKCAQEKGTAQAVSVIQTLDTGSHRSYDHAMRARENLDSSGRTLSGLNTASVGERLLKRGERLLKRVGLIKAGEDSLIEGCVSFDDLESLKAKSSRKADHEPVRIYSYISEPYVYIMPCMHLS